MAQEQGGAQLHGIAKCKSECFGLINDSKCAHLDINLEYGRVPRPHVGEFKDLQELCYSRLVHK